MISRVPKVLAAMKELHFSAPFNCTDFAGRKRIKRCPHFSIRASSASPIDSPGSEDSLPPSQGDDGTYVRKQEDMMDVEELFDIEHGDFGLMKLSRRIIRLLSVLPDNQLSSFR